LKNLFQVVSQNKKPVIADPEPLATTPKGLYLWGSVGTGKSMLMDIFYNTLPIPRKQRTHFHTFMQHVHTRIHVIRGSHRHSFDAIPHLAHEIAAHSWVLCFDELQVTDISDAMILRRLFAALVSRGVVFVTTSNRPPDELYKNGIQRKSFLPAISLLKRVNDVVELAGPIDYRKRDRMRIKVFFEGDDDGAVDLLWRRLVEDQPVAPLTLNYLGRHRTYPKTVDGTYLRTTFAELCGQPASAADYLRLATQFRVVVLTDIPQMNQQSRNEARRFITLLDALYEARRVLICQASTDINRLFEESGGEVDRLLVDDLKLEEKDYRIYGSGGGLCISKGCVKIDGDAIC
ncbi:hypothetical protein HK096_007801, partial [Nowakowskiella sp. JEL0078]